MRSLAMKHQLVLMSREALSVRRLEQLYPDVNFAFEPVCITTDALFRHRSLELPWSLDGVIHAATCYGRNGESKRELIDSNFRYNRCWYN